MNSFTKIYNMLFTIYNQCTRIFSRFLFPSAVELTKCYCFSAGTPQYIKNVKVLETLKSKESIPDSFYLSGKYLLFLEKEMVCLKGMKKIVFNKYIDIKKWKSTNSSPILLDVLTEGDSNICVFAVDLEGINKEKVKEIEEAVGGKFVNLRQSLFFLTEEDSQYASQARGLIHFNTTHKFCTYCGGALKMKGAAGHQKVCTSCNASHYPTLSPVGLTLIEDETHQEVLLVRQGRHPPGMYSCVAGFIEPGESLEESIRREVAEEVGLFVSKVDYCTSQHWAFPSCQLSLGCIATTSEKVATIDLTEIEDAQWVGADVLKEAVVRTRRIQDLSEMKSEKLWTPPRNAVSHNLMVAWLTKYHNFSTDSNS